MSPTTTGPLFKATRAPKPGSPSAARPRSDGETLLDLDGGAHGPQGVVRLGHGCAEEGHDAVADELVERAAGTEDGLHREVQEGVDRLGHPLGRRVLGEGREAHEVGEEHGSLGGLEAPRPVALAQHLLDDARRMVALQLRARLLLDLGPLGVADALDGHRHVVGESRQHVQIPLAEGPHLEGGVDLDDAQDAVARPERGAHGGADLVHADGLAAREPLVGLGVEGDEGHPLAHDRPQHGARNGHVARGPDLHAVLDPQDLADELAPHRRRAG